MDMRGTKDPRVRADAVASIAGVGRRDACSRRRALRRWMSRRARALARSRRLGVPRGLASGRHGQQRCTAPLAPQGVYGRRWPARPRGRRCRACAGSGAGLGQAPAGPGLGLRVRRVHCVLRLGGRGRALCSRCGGTRAPAVALESGLVARTYARPFGPGRLPPLSRQLRLGCGYSSGGSSAAQAGRHVCQPRFRGACARAL